MGNLESSKVRIKALLKELDRLQLEIRTKKIWIRVIIAVIILVTVVICCLFYNQTEDLKPQPIQVKRNDGDLVKNEKPKSKFSTVYQLVFDSLNEYPLARFIDKEKAFSFQEEIKSLRLPKTHINIDSLDGKEKILALSLNYRYYIQVGTFRKQLISDLPDNMVYLHQIKARNLYRYRLGPFAKRIQAKNLVADLNLKDYLIVEVSE